MKITDITDTEELRDFMTTPSGALIRFMKTLKGDISILGGSGKMGPELLEMVLKADNKAGKKRKIIVASTFSDPKIKNRMDSLGAVTFKGDLSDTGFLARLPCTKNVIYAVGFKFGSSGDWNRTFHMNSIVPYLTGEKYSDSDIVVFSSGNPYPHTKKEYGGCRETDALNPQGVYGWSIVARESSFNITASRSKNQKICFFRLMYAQHLAYGVLVDLARMVRDGEEISLEMPYVNLISQRDANECVIRSLGICSNPPVALNVSGPAVSVRYIIDTLGKLMDIKPLVKEGASDSALLANDSFCVRKFGPYRDGAEDMIKAAAKWVMNNGEYWEKPTKFGRSRHDY